MCLDGVCELRFWSHHLSVLEARILALLPSPFDDRKKDAKRGRVRARARAVSSANGGIYTQALVFRMAELEREVASTRESLGRQAHDTD